MRNFLTEKRCFDELILLEKEWGNFEQAAKVARLKPDPVLEADLLHMGGLHRESSLIILWHPKQLLLLDEICGEFVEAAKISNEDEHSIEATLSRIWYVFFGSLWACGRRAWPLKDFKHKAELLDDVKSYVMDHPDSQDSDLVHTEIHVLSDEEICVSHMWKYLRETPRERSLRIHFCISRRILDVHLGSNCSVYVCIETRIEDETIKHLEGDLVENIVSVEGLMYFWNYWKEMICELIN
ncbi:hypothetical protein L1987_32996 [Smallanthus sonchifolius]|uniref:Uncharacterized protein n=1 Tax=Smallanthus sonchifolius TaxID=185202 RepID=A0ACB9HR08_9ASTR|nr:hypothetical protein L1987_32996 [Smallanthus sonchifolius]